MNNRKGIYYNNSGYFDVTAGQALDRIAKEEALATDKLKLKKKRRKHKKKELNRDTKLY